MKIAFFKDIDIDEVEEARKNHHKLKVEFEKLKERAKNTEAARSELYIANKVNLSNIADYEKEIEMTMRSNNVLLQELCLIRVDLGVEETKLDNDRLDETTELLLEKAPDIDTRIRAPTADLPRGYNPFKRHTADQRATMKASVNLILKILELAV